MKRTRLRKANHAFRSFVEDFHKSVEQEGTNVKALTKYLRTKEVRTLNRQLKA